MKRSRLSRPAVSTFLLVTAMTLLLIWSGGNQASAVGVSPAGVDVTTSLGKFTIELTPAFGGATVTSPLLFDPSTTIGRSDPFDDGDATDTGGAPICEMVVGGSCTSSLPATVADSDFAVVPAVDGNPFDEGPPNTDEVHTQIIDLNMVGVGTAATAVRAGISAPTAPRSIGEVESLTAAAPGAGEGVFPAESFFNVFVEVDIDGNSDGDLDDPQDVTVFNKATEPLLIENGNLLAFPPDVIYVHGNTNAVKVFDKANPATLVGHLIVAGHGIGFNVENPADVAEFDAVYEELLLAPMPIPPVGGTVELLADGPDSPASAADGSGSSSAPYAALAAGLAAAVLALGAGGWYVRRRWLR